MITTKKYTVIVSAWQTSETLENNLIASDEIQCYLKNIIKVGPAQAIGFYDGISELSFIVHTDHLHIVQAIAHHASRIYNQKCILVRHGPHNTIALWYLGARIKVEIIGNRFEQFGTGAQYQVNKPSAYTILNGTYWEVVK